MRYIIVCLLIFITTRSTAQVSEYQGHVWLKYGYGSTDAVNYHDFGISGEYLIHRNIGLNYNLEFLRYTDQSYHLHSSVGALAGPPLILIGLLYSNGNSGSFDLGKFGVLLGLAILVAPDGVCFHIPVGYHWDLSPYANVLGVDYLRPTNATKGIFKWASSFGVKTTYWQEKGFTLNAFAETRKVASIPWGFGAGLGIGYVFSPRNSTKEITVE